jgi:8-oxo-dGTP pyrophosphatase MutT (NUDIX family)
MGQLTVADKQQVIKRILALEQEFGPAPLRNIEPASLVPCDIDVVAVGCMILRADRSTVLIRRSETPNEWVIPGGTVEPGEDVVETAIRETREETGLDTAIDGLLRIGLARNYGPQAFRKANLRHFGKEIVSLLFVNFRSRELGGNLNCSNDPGQNTLEVRRFRKIPFNEITHIYKVLFVQQGLYHASLSDYPAVEFDTANPFIL